MKMADLGGAIFSLSSLKSRTRPEEKLLYQTLLREFKQLYSLQDDDEALRMLFYQVPFEKVMDQVHSRNVIVKNGVAYVPQKLQTVLLVNAFKERLIQALESTAKALPRM